MRAKDYKYQFITRRKAEQYVNTHNGNSGHVLEDLAKRLHKIHPNVSDSAAKTIMGYCFVELGLGRRHAAHIIFKSTGFDRTRREYPMARRYVMPIMRGIVEDSARLGDNLPVEVDNTMFTGEMVVHDGKFYLLQHDLNGVNVVATRLVRPKLRTHSDVRKMFGLVVEDELNGLKS